MGLHAHFEARNGIQYVANYVRTSLAMGSAFEPARTGQYGIHG